MEGLDVDDIFQHYRLNPTEVEAVTYYLPRLLSGETLHGAEKLIHDADIYSCEPKDLAARYSPVPQAVGSGDRFFFTTCKSKNGSKLQSVRGAGAGTWTIQKTTEISYAGGKVGEVKNLSFKKKGKSTGWVMEEYRCLLPEATVAEGVKVFCKIHLAQHAPAAARQESAAYKLQELQPEAVAASTHAQKRPATAAAADPHPLRPNKRMRVAATPSFTGAAPVFLPDEYIPEADNDMSRFSCSIEELLGLQVDETLRVGATKNIVPLEAEENYSEPDEELQFLTAILDEVVAEQERQAVSTNEKSSMVQDVGSNKPPAIFSHPSEAEWQVDEALGEDGEADGFDIEELTRMMEADPIEVEPVTRANTGVEMDQQEDGEADGFDIEELTRMMEADPIEVEPVTRANTGVEMDQQEDGEADGFDIEELTRMMEADPIDVEPVTRANTGVEMDQQEPLYLDCLDQRMLEDMLQSDYPHPMQIPEDRAFHDADKEKRYNAASDLDDPSLQGQDHLFKPQPCSFDPFEAAWKAEEAFENERRCNANAAANLHPGGHSNFFSPASVH